MTAVLGLDLSLTSTGYASWIDGALDVGRLRPKAKMHPNMRLAWIRNAIDNVIAPHNVSAMPYDLIVIEDLPPSGHFGFNQNGLAMVQCVTRLCLYDARLDATWVNIQSLKVFATGKGNAKKEQVLLEASRRLGYAGDSNDEADALWLMHMGLTKLGACPVALPATHTRAMEGIQWVLARP